MSSAFQFRGLAALLRHEIDLLVTPDPVERLGLEYAQYRSPDLLRIEVKMGARCNAHDLTRLATGSAAVIATPNAAHSCEARLEDADIIGELVLVAGVGFEPTTFRL